MKKYVCDIWAHNTLTPNILLPVATFEFESSNDDFSLIHCDAVEQFADYKNALETNNRKEKNLEYANYSYKTNKEKYCVLEEYAGMNSINTIYYVSNIRFLSE